MSYPQKRFRPWRVERYRDDGTWRVLGTFATEERANERLDAVLLFLPDSERKNFRVRKYVEFEARD